MTPFDLVLLPFPFTDLSTHETKALSHSGGFQPRGLSENYVVAMVTGDVGSVAFPGDTRFTKWREAGLAKPSIVRLAKVVTIERSLVRKKLGTVQASDRQAIRRQFRKVFGECV